MLAWQVMSRQLPLGPLGPSGPREALGELVLSYLLHRGYTETAECFTAALRDGQALGGAACLPCPACCLKASDENPVDPRPALWATQIRR